MTDNFSHANLLLESRENLLRMREDVLLSEAEIATVDQGIVALDRLITEFSTQR